MGDKEKIIMQIINIADEDVDNFRRMIVNAKDEWFSDDAQRIVNYILAQLEPPAKDTTEWTKLTSKIP